MNELTKRVLECVRATNGAMNDYDQRSALGMARTWLDKGEPVGWHPDKNKDQVEYRKRDDLAKALVEVLEGEDRDDCITALQAARAEVNAPFLDPSMVGWQAARAKRGLVGSVKKNERETR